MNCGKYDTIVANDIFFVDLQIIVLYWSDKSITTNNKYNEYNYNPLQSCNYQISMYPEIQT